MTAWSQSRWPKWGTPLQAWPADHADEIRHDLNNLELKPILDFDYLAACDAVVDAVSKL